MIPAVRAGAVASKDMAASALVSSASIASVYKTKVNNVNIDVTNMASLVKTSPIDIGNYGGTEYNLSNQVLKNGITAEFPTKVDLFGKPLSVETSVANTHISGDEVYVNNYNDFALSLGTPSDASADGSSQLRLGVTHTKGNHDYKATKLNFGYDTL